MSSPASPDSALSNRQKRYLRGLTHHLQPVVTVADKGLTENVLAEIENALQHHELVKIKLRADRSTRSRWGEEIEKSSGATLVHSIGQVACYFRRNPEKPVIALPD
jgi:RNA-binding protein